MDQQSGAGKGFPCFGGFRSARATDLRLLSCDKVLEPTAERLRAWPIEPNREEVMLQSVKTAADTVLNKAVNSTPGVPGVVAVATDRNANIYAGAFGVRQAGASAAMTTDSIF